MRTWEYTVSKTEIKTEKDIYPRGINIPEGFEDTHEFRPPKYNDWFLSATGGEVPAQCSLFDNFTTNEPRIILRKVVDPLENVRNKIVISTFENIYPNGISKSLFNDYDVVDFRLTKSGDYYVLMSGVAASFVGVAANPLGPRLIVKPKEKK